MKDNAIYKAIIATIATTFHFMFGGWTIILQILITFIAIDYITGVMAAFVKKELDSEIGGKGIAKKVGYLFLVAIAHMIDKVTGTGSPILMTGTIYFLMANEGLSIFENLGELNVPLPKFLVEAVTRLSDREDAEDV